jgi:3-hydroxybutyryl-CoA dehydrogenase
MRRVTVIGAGTMGHGIAQVAAGAGLDVALYGIAAIHANLDKGVDRGKVTAEQREATLSRVTAFVDLEPALAGADLAIEAAPESIDLKRRIFGELDRFAPAGAVLASNTSSLPIAAIAAATERPGSVVGMHFFNPVHLMQLVEVVRGAETSDETLDTAVRAGREMGKDPIVVRDSPGFASSRLGLVLGLEAIRMLEQGVATAEDIDKAMTLGYRHPMGDRSRRAAGNRRASAPRVGFGGVSPARVAAPDGRGGRVGQEDREGLLRLVKARAAAVAGRRGRSSTRRREATWNT